MTSSVVVATYEAARALDLVLAALSRQSVLPGEIVVADDGSGAATAVVVQAWQRRMPVPVLHVHQVDRGYRKARIVNEAVRRSSGEHLIFLDGDSFPHRDWVADHVDAADGASVLCGRRVKLGPNFSSSVCVADVLAGRFDTVFDRDLLASALRRDTKRLALGLRLPWWLAAVLHPRSRKLMGVNFSLPRSAFFAVNGYDEGWREYGPEDRDLELRLQRSGWRFRPLLNRAIVFHLWHRERERSAAALARIEAAERSDRIRCRDGLSGGEAFDPSR